MRSKYVKDRDFDGIKDIDDTQSDIYIGKDNVSDDDYILSDDELSNLNIINNIKETDDLNTIFSDGEYDVITPNFYSISQEVEKAINDSIIKKYTSSMGNSNNTIISEGSKNKTSFLDKRFVVSSVVLIVSIGVMLGGGKIVKNYKSENNIENQISNLYTSSKKEDLKSNISSNEVLKYYEKLDSVDNLSKSDKDRMVEELDTISQYISDRGIIDKINDNNFDLNTNSIKDDLETIKKSSSEYSVSSLSSSMLRKVNNVESDYNYFLNLKDELSILKDDSDIDEYQLKINKVSHTLNRKELQSMLDSVSNKAKISSALEDIKNDSNKKVEDTLNDVKDDLSDNTKGFFSSVLDELKDFFTSDDNNSKDNSKEVQDLNKSDSQ